MSCPLLYLRPLLPLHLTLSPPNLSLSKRFSLFSSLSSNQTLSLAPSHSLTYGPSLFKGRNPNPSPNEEPTTSESSIDKSLFSRAFDIAALRVPAADCSALERRLRGHLLNWPRVRNVARVEGDDLDPNFKNLLRNPPAVSEDRLDALDRRSSEREKEILSPVLYREKLVKDFNCRGFIKFRNLAKISRPKKKKKKRKNEMEEEEGEVKDRRGKDEVYAVEVVGNEEEEDWSSLIGERFKGERWNGPTRLLLLDERYAKKGVDEMPEAVKVASIFCELVFSWMIQFNVVILILIGFEIFVVDITSCLVFISPVLSWHFIG